MKPAGSANDRRSWASQNSGDVQGRREANSTRQIKWRESQTSEKLKVMGEADSLDPPEIPFQKMTLRSSNLAFEKSWSTNTVQWGKTCHASALPTFGS